MKARFLIPLGVFLALIVLFVVGLQRDPREVPSPLVGKPAPEFELPALTAPDQTIGRNTLKQHPVSLFNVWASWCTACRQEHPFLLELARRNEIPIYGLNYKDERVDAMRWLKQLGDPYLESAYDRDGRVGIDWGVYGVPETFVVDGDGMILYKHIGPLSERVWREKIRPLIDDLKAKRG